MTSKRKVTRKVANDISVTNDVPKEWNTLSEAEKDLVNNLIEIISTQEEKPSDGLQPTQPSLTGQFEDAVSDFCRRYPNHPKCIKPIPSI